RLIHPTDADRRTWTGRSERRASLADPRTTNDTAAQRCGTRTQQMNKDILELDGAIGGGQVLRSALSLSMISGQPFRIRNIRARRSRPGLLRQHLTAVLAAAKISSAQVEIGRASCRQRVGSAGGVGDGAGERR